MIYVGKFFVANPSDGMDITILIGGIKYQKDKRLKDKNAANAGKFMR